jgi:hypothetical protein
VAHQCPLEIAEAVRSVLDSPAYAEEARNLAVNLGSANGWDQIAERYRELVTGRRDEPRVGGMR